MVGSAFLRGRYRIEELLGEGGMGRVYRAYDTELRRRVALKIVKGEDELAAGRANVAERLLREARILAGLSHPNIVAVYDVGEVDGTKFIAMELLDGATLRAQVGRSDVPLATRVAWLLDVARALTVIHAAGVVHRDVKPDNVVVGADGVAKLLDFGIAKELVSRADTAAPTVEHPAHSLTDARHAIGTPSYMSPEQAMGNPVDAKSDQFAWGVLAYELVSGVHPLPPHACADEIVVRRRLREDAPEAPEALEHLVARATAVRPEERFESFVDVVRALEGVVARPPSAYPPTRIGPLSAPPAGERTEAFPLRPGAVLGGKYRVVRVLGRGGMGVVVLAHHEELDQHVAIKVLTGEAAAEAEAVARFTREARAAAKLQSEHVVRVMDVGRWAGVGPYIVMEYLEGVDLQRLLVERGPLPIVEAVDHVVEAAQGLSEAHRHGIVHRDLKPSNLFLARRSSGSALIKVLDFGISKMDAFGAPANELTATRAVMGTPHYMSPEQLRSAKEVDARADVWSLGVVLYQLLTAARPFEGDTIGRIFTAIATGDLVPPRARRADIPPALEAVILRCLRNDPRERFDGMAALAETLHMFGSGKTLRERQRHPGWSEALPALTPPPPAPLPPEGPRTQGAWGVPVRHVPAARPAGRTLAFGAIPVAVVAVGVAAWLGLHARHLAAARAGASEEAIPTAASAAAVVVPPAPSASSASSASPASPASSGATGVASVQAPNPPGEPSASASASPAPPARTTGKPRPRRTAKPAATSAAPSDLVNQREWF